MENNLFRQGPKKERSTLLLLSISFGIIGSLVLFFTDKEIFPYVLLTLSFCSFIGFAAYNLIGRDVFLLLGMISLAIGYLISWLTVRLVYITGIVFFGLLFSLFGMDRMKKKFKHSKGLTTNFEDAPETDIESFWRQS